MTEFLIIVVLGLAPIVARAAEGEMALHELYSVGTLLWVSVIALFGGFVAYMGRLSRKGQKEFRIVELIGELAASTLSGWITFFLATKANYSIEITVAMVAMSGHMGTRGLFFLERVYKRFIDKASDVVLGETDKNSGKSERDSDETDPSL